MSRYHLIEGTAVSLPPSIRDKSVSLVFGSPPYPGKMQRYPGINPSRQLSYWLEMMQAATREAIRVSRGPVLWVINNAVERSRYIPAVEMLMERLHSSGLHLERPVIWHKNAPPNRRDWFGNDWEYIVAVKHPGSVPHWDWQAIATPPKFKNGGRFHQRTANGSRRLGGEYPTGKLARPRDVVRMTVGGGHLGHELAHENEAPFPVALASHFIRALCPAGGTVLDPFCGSGSTGHAALELGRKFIGVDIRTGVGGLDTARRRLWDVLSKQEIAC